MNMNKMTDNLKDKFDSRASSKAANETTDENGFCKTTRDAIVSVCNVCGKACTKQCSLCRLAFYCSVECQRSDWKRHKAECKGRKVAKKKQVGLTLESLPDDVLIHIGHTVAVYCEAYMYRAFAHTSKRIYSLLMDKPAIKSLLAKENERIYRGVFCEIPCPNDITGYYARSLRQLQLCQLIAKHKTFGWVEQTRLYIDGNDFENYNEVRKIVHMIGFALLRNRGTIVVLDANSGLFGDDQAIKELALEIGYTLYRFFENLWQEEGAGREWTRRVWFRFWGSTTVWSALQIDDEHAMQVRDGKAWVEVCFKFAEDYHFCVPPTPLFYYFSNKNVGVPTLTPYMEHHDFMVRTRFPIAPEEEIAMIEPFRRMVNELKRRAEK